jgi:hypothetical protein
LQFQTGGSERMRIDSSGDVQIGSTNSGVGGLIDLSIGNTSSSGGITLWATTTASHSIGFGDGYTGTDRYRGYLEYAHNGDSMRFATSATERMRIDSSGNVGIGTTAPTDYYADNLVVNAQSEGGITLIGTSAHENYLAWADGTSGTERYSGYLSYNHSSNVSCVLPLMAVSERMRIDSSGNVGIGTTAPDAKLSVNGVASFGDGTALLPSIANFGDLDTGMWFPAADTIAFSEGGVEAMRITSAGNVGIGTTTPTTGSDYGNLSLNGTLGGQLAFHTGGTGKQYIYSSSTDLNIYNSIAGNLIFHTNSTERMRINSSGNVGIGTSSPDAKLHVNGLIEANGSLYRGIFGGAVQDGDMTGATGGNGSEVQIQSPSSIRPASLTLGGSLGNNELLGVIGFYNSGNTDGKRLRAYIRSGQEGATANEQGALMVFSTASDAASTPTERMRIDSSGNVGIGTNAPADTLNIGAGTKFRATHSASIYQQIYSTASGNFIKAFGDNFAIDSVAGALYLSTLASQPMVFQTNNTEGMRIDSSGNVGIGTSSPATMLQVNGETTIFGTPSTSVHGVKFRNTYATGAHLFSQGLGTVNTYIDWINANGTVGSISATGSGVAYNTSSDYRLKTDAQPMTGASERLLALKPINFAWKVDGTRVDGFLAHEVQDIVPEAITGTKDATETKEKVVVNANGNVIAEDIEQADWETGKIADEDGNTTYPIDSTWEATKVVPVYQGIDQAKLVPLLVKTIQELEARITALETNQP